MIKTLVDHQSIRHDKRLRHVGAIDEILHSYVAPFNVFSCQVFFLFATLNNCKLSLQFSNFLFEARNDNSRINSLISSYLILNEGHTPSKSTSTDAFVEIFRAGRHCCNHFSFTITSKRVSQNHCHHRVSIRDVNIRTWLLSFLV